jgi:hypothetical protein
LAHAPEAPRPAQATPAEKPTRDPTEVALSAIAEALDLKTGLDLEPSERRALHERLERVALRGAASDPFERAEAAFAADVARVAALDSSEEEALADLKEALKHSINARLGSPDDHLASIRNQLKSVLLHVQSR